MNDDTISDHIFNNEKIFPEPFRVFEKDSSTLDEAKDSSIIVLDTNILLFPYTISSHSLSSIKQIYKKLIQKDRLLIPKQVAREFAKNRNAKLSEIYSSILTKNQPKLSKNIKYPILENLPEYTELLEIEKDLESYSNKYNEQLKKLSKTIKKMERNDPVSVMYYELFKQKNIVHHDKSNDDIKKDLEFRLKNKIPPGYKDAKKVDNGVGDLIIWNTILKLAKDKKENLIFVSNDEKSDWYNKSNGQSFLPRYELIDEYKRHSDGKTIHIINFSNFLNIFDIDDQASKEIEKKESLKNTFSNNAISDFGELYDNKIDEIHTWFFEHYDDPVNLLPYESKEGGYQYIWGGPYSTDDIIYGNFGELPQVFLDDLLGQFEELYGDIEWSPIPSKHDLDLDT